MSEAPHLTDRMDSSLPGDDKCYGGKEKSRKRDGRRMYGAGLCAILSSVNHTDLFEMGEWSKDEGSKA